MASSASAKSLPLHNFELPKLKWNKNGQSGGLKKCRRSIKSPSQRPNTSSTPPLSHSVLQEHVPVAPPRLPSPLRVSAMVSSCHPLVYRDCLMKQSSFCGESSKPSPNREELKNSPIVGDSASLLHEEALRHFQRQDSSLELEALMKGKGGLIEYCRNHPKNSAFADLKNGINSSNPEQAKKKLEKKI